MNSRGRADRRSDIRDASSIGDAFDGVDTVFHVAALPRIPLSIAKPVETHMTNVVGTLNVLIAARDRKVRRVVYSGSSSVYGEQAKMPLVETMTPNPLNPYALQKYVGEQYARMFHRLFAMQTITLRYFGVYGPRMPQRGIVCAGDRGVPEGAARGPAARNSSATASRRGISRMSATWCRRTCSRWTARCLLMGAR